MIDDSPSSPLLTPLSLFGFALAGLLDLFEIKFDQRRHLRRLPVGLLGVLGPCPWEVDYLSGFFSLLQKGENL